MYGMSDDLDQVFTKNLARHRFLLMCIKSRSIHTQSTVEFLIRVKLIET